MMMAREFQSYLTQDLDPIFARVYSAQIKELSNEWPTSTEARAVGEDNKLNLVVEFLLNQLTATKNDIDELRRLYRHFLRDLRFEKVETKQRQVMLDFCARLGGKDRKGDLKAFSRWFDKDAITERWQRAINDLEAKAIFLMQRISFLFDALVFSAHDDELLGLWGAYKFEQRLLDWVQYTFQVRVQKQALACLSSSLKLLGDKSFRALSADFTRFVFRAALDSTQDPEIQIEAFSLLTVADIKQAVKLLDHKLGLPQTDNDLFFRQAIPEAINLHHLVEPELLGFIPQLIQDDCSLVRAKVVDCAPAMDSRQLNLLINALKNDPQDSVFITLVSRLPLLCFEPEVIELFKMLIVQEQRASRLRAVLEFLPMALNGAAVEQQDVLRKQVNDALNKALSNHSDPKVQYWMLEAREQLWASQQLDCKQCLQVLLQSHHGQKVWLNTEQKQLLDTDRGKRWLAANMGQGFSIELSERWAYRGNRFGVRLWRFIHEFLRPATDKRQHHSHIKGRIYFGLSFIASKQWAEVSKTKVPGEPLFIEEDGHMRPFLPLVDQLISCLDQGWPTQPLSIYHADGITRVMPPGSLHKRLWAKWQLSIRFNYYANLRNWHSGSGFKVGDYLNAIRKLGFSFSIDSYQDEYHQTQYQPARSTSRFFGVALPLSPLALWESFQQYFVSVYQNSLTHLIYFLIAMMGIFWGTHVRASERFRRARKKIPLVVGGWGTRGKSGTERLKAALFNQLGMSVVSKTTGCEAMFLYSNRYGALKEMFLFRPYDKATIWEQANVTQITADMNADVLLWECMGLTPRYIEILQQQWMRDDLSTITNCFPDHEDLQGPAGIDIPQVMTNFVPRGGELFSTEDNMAPYLYEEAERKGSQYHYVGWLDVARIPKELMDRFPYEEHPANIALVAKMGERLGMSRVMSIKAMADNVVADIGVLKVFPQTMVEGRTLQFINGMSANERFGAISNWNRLEFNKINYIETPDTLICTVINNRADRVARSKVFTDLVSLELSAHRHFVIGSNLDGFRQYLKESWSRKLEQLDWSAEPESTLEDLLVYLRVPTNTSELVAIMCTLGFDGINEDSIASVEQDLSDDAIQSLSQQQNEPLGDDAVQFLSQEVSYFVQTQKLRASFAKQLDVDDIEDFVTQVFMSRFIFVDDYFIPGNQLIQFMARQLPKGYQCKLLGLQNIKGTGLDFVYCWQQWDTVCNQVIGFEEKSAEDIEMALAELGTINVFGVLEMEFLDEQLHKMKGLQQCQSEHIQSEIEQLQFMLKKSQQNLSGDSGQSSSRFEGIINAIEAFLDVGDAVKRSKRAKLVLKDLVNQRISLNRAAYELKTINKRQKGGWLKQSWIK